MVAKRHYIWQVSRIEPIIHIKCIEHVGKRQVMLYVYDIEI